MKLELKKKKQKTELSEKRNFKFKNSNFSTQILTWKKFENEYYFPHVFVAIFIKNSLKDDFNYKRY